jgi:transposase InsO family protein
VIAQLATEGLPVKTSCRLLSVSTAGFYEWKTRPLSPRAIRHAWLTDVIRDVHTASRGTYGAPRVHAELRLGREIVVGHNVVARLMRNAGLVGLPLKRRLRRTIDQAPSVDLVERNFARSEPDQMWVTDITAERSRIS